MSKKLISSINDYPTRKDIISDLSTLDDGIHKIWDMKDSLYQGIVKDNKVLFYVSSVGSVYKNICCDDFEEVGQLSNPSHFVIIAKFNKWI